MSKPSYEEQLLAAVEQTMYNPWVPEHVRNTIDALSQAVQHLLKLQIADQQCPEPAAFRGRVWEEEYRDPRTAMEKYLNGGCTDNDCKLCRYVALGWEIRANDFHRGIPTYPDPREEK